MTSSPPLLMLVSHPRPLQKILPHALVGISLLSLYLVTLAPGLTWANNGSDGGDLITAAATGGIAHPTGYPLYLLLARLLQFLPTDSLAFRTNLMSALAAALAAAWVSGLVARSSPLPQTWFGWLPGMAAGLAFGLAPLIWSQAVITEVYSLHALLSVLIIHLYSHPPRDPDPRQIRMDYARGLVLGLAMGNHITTILLVPAALLVGSVRHQPQADGYPPHTRNPWSGGVNFNGSSLLRQLVSFGAGLSVYLILPLRAISQPLVNWGNPITPERLWWLMSGHLYQAYNLSFSPPIILTRLQAGAALLLEQFGLPGLILGLLGLIVFARRSRLYILTGWLAAANTVFAVVYRSEDSYVYLIPTFLAFAIWLGLGLAGLTQPLTRLSSMLRLCIGLIVIGYFAMRVVAFIPDVDASEDRRAESFGQEILSLAPKDAILLAKGDQAVFTLWYFHFALAERPDVAVLAVDLLHFDWYQENLHSTYPSLVVPGPYPWPETIAGVNTSRAVCRVQYAGRPEIDCSRPMSTP